MAVDEAEPEVLYDGGHHADEHMGVEMALRIMHWLVDGYGTVDSVARDVIKAGDVRDFSVKQNFAEKFAKQFGADMAEGAANVLTRFTLR